ncbi:MAG TPA: hypothetical protein VG297_09320 [Bryobacteraceae bacterium]|jgi:hypothetical protein|nr:hypothetical protein [Bryobacteraceae bacterium]
MGLRDPGVRESIAAALRKLLEAERVSAPVIPVETVSELKRGKTGKAPLIMGLRA